MKVVPEHPDEDQKKCPNCASPLVIRDDIWVCFTCNFEEKVIKHAPHESH